MIVLPKNGSSPIKCENKDTTISVPEEQSMDQSQTASASPVQQFDEFEPAGNKTGQSSYEHLSPSPPAAKSSGNDMENLVDMLPNISRENIKFVYAESGNNFLETTNCLVDGPTSDSIRSLLYFSRITTSMTESPRIRLEADDDSDDWVSAATAYYNSANFDPHAEVRIAWRGQPAIDTGGVRPQFFSTVFQRIAFQRNTEFLKDHLITFVQCSGFE